MEVTPSSAVTGLSTDACKLLALSNRFRPRNNSRPKKDAAVVRPTSGTQPIAVATVAHALALYLAVVNTANTAAAQPAGEAALFVQRQGSRVGQHSPRGSWLRSQPSALEVDTHDTQGGRLELRRRPDQHHNAPQTR